MTALQKFAQLLIQGVARGSVYSLIALGYTMVYGVLRLINFAHGDVYMVGAFIAWFAIRSWHLSFLPALALSMLGCGLLGVAIERCAYRPLRKQPRLAALITAIGVSLLLEYGGQLISASPQYFPEHVLTGHSAAALKAAAGALYSRAGVSIAPAQIATMIASVVLMLALRLFVARTKVGKAMQAVAQDRDTASLMGIGVDNIISVTFFIGSALAAAAGVLVALEEPQIDPLMGLWPGVRAFVAAVVGGIGNIPGAMLGGLIMGVAEYLVVGYISSNYRDAIAFAVLIVVLLVRPTGLTGKGVTEKV